uniref:Uncharacterized protein n=1 Tax=Amphimedon queenslandica TaxID=400682 RepID=A0A1X7TE89_AMPQE
MEFDITGATYFDNTDDAANIGCIVECVKRRWGEEYIIVASDGIEFEDSPSTR